MLKQKFHFKLLTLLTGSALAFASLAQTESTVIIEADGVSITFTDVQAELQRATPDMRKGILLRKDAISQLASNLLMRRVLAKNALEAGLKENAVNQASLRLARDRVLSDLQLENLDRLNQPTEQVIERLAREQYKAEGKLYEIPEQVKASHILFLLTAENAEDMAKALLAELKSGSDFDELAKTRSQDTSSAAKGGDLGYFARNRMAKGFEDAAFGLQPGELSGIVKTQFGYHIIKVTGRKSAGKQPFEEVKDGLIKDIAQKIVNEGRLNIGEKIMSRAKAFPEVLDAFIASQTSR